MTHKQTAQSELLVFLWKTLCWSKARTDYVSGLGAGLCEQDFTCANIFSCIFQPPFVQYDHTTLDKSKQQWSDKETQCFLALWSSSEVQAKLEGACRTKPVFENIQKGMAEAGYDRTVVQLINKLKEWSGSGKMPFFDVLHAVLSDWPANQATTSRCSPPAMQILVSCNPIHNINFM